MVEFNIALLAFGLSGRIFHAPFITHHPGFKLAGAWERNGGKLKEIYPGALSYRSLDELLQDDSIDIVVVNTPTYTHFEYASRALRAGKHVIVEKAFTTTLAEAVELKELALSVNKQIAVYQNRRWDSDFRTVVKVIDSGMLGEIIESEIRFDRFKIPLSSKTHKEEPNPGAGLLKDLGAHIIDQALVLFGMPHSLFAELRSLRPGSKVDDWVDIQLYYPTIRVHLKASLLVKEPLPGYCIHGSNGSFLKSRGDVQETELTKGVTPGIPGWGQEPINEQGVVNYFKNGVSRREMVLTLPGKYMEFYNGVHNSLTQQLPMPVTADDGIRVMKIIEAAIKSNELRTIVEI